MPFWRYGARFGLTLVHDPAARALVSLAGFTLVINISEQVLPNVLSAIGQGEQIDLSRRKNAKPIKKSHNEKSRISLQFTFEVDYGRAERKRKEEIKG